MKKIFLIACMMIVLSVSALAEVMISEIMYNPFGTETKKEWIELYNNGNSEINISGWKIDDDSQRTLTLYRGDFIIMPDSFTILARNGENFSNEYPEYNGTILASTFSLTNSGKELKLIDSEDNIAESINYTDIAEEGYSIEINETEWIQGQLNGKPGEILKNNFNGNLSDNSTEEEENEDDDNNQNQVPEFNSLGAGLIIILSGLAIAKIRKN